MYKHALFLLLIGPGILISAVTTRYSPVESCHYPAPQGGCLTASGRIAQEGITVACPRHYALGTRVVINNHTYTCDDRTSTRAGIEGRFYIFGESYDEAIQWGVRKLPVLILN